MQFAEFVQTQGRPVSFAAGDHVFRQGDENRSVYVLQRGLLKACYLSESGKEFVKSFIQPGDLIASLAAAYLDDHCSFSVVSLESSIAVEVDFEALHAARNRSPELFSKVTQKDVARYLGITPVALSRIRNRADSG